MYFSFKIKVPAFIESIIVYFLLRYRKKHYGLAFRRIKLTNGKPATARYAIVDPDDYRKLAKEDWQLFENSTDNFYAVRFEGKNLVRMHRVIMNAPPGKIVDHRNGNGLDNTRRNLRFATPSQNSCNCRRRQNGSSKYRGVYFAKNRGKWRAQINYNGTRRHLGYFDNQEDAARAYDNAAKIYHGDFAVLNFPQDNRAPNACPSKPWRRWERDARQGGVGLSASERAIQAG